MAGKLKQLVSSRANYRGQVNQIYAEAGNFVVKSASERETILSKLKRLRNELDNLDPVIRDLKWESNSSEEDKAISENNRD